LREVVITGLGILLPNCDRREIFWDQVSRGDSQLEREPDPAREGQFISVGRIRDFDPARYFQDLPRRFYQRYPRELQFYLASLILAQRDAGVEWEALDSHRVGLFDGASRPTLVDWYEKINEAYGKPLAEAFTRRDLMFGIPGQTIGTAASLFKVRGPTYTFTSTCSSGSVAIGHAWREIATGEIDVAFATGHEASLMPALFAMYGDAGLLSRNPDPKRAVNPYVGYSTNAFGEGAVTLSLESREHAEARGANILATLGGYRYGNNGYHPTTVDVVAVRPAEVIERVLERSQTPREEIGFVVGHGNGVQISDVSEENYMRRVFGARASEVPLISVKPIYGHTLGASSSINTAAAVMMVMNDYVVPTINITPGGVKRVSNHQAGEGETKVCRAGLATSYGMGGHNTVVLVKKFEG
jgi:3-oxoacyl-[acyl-carrier-protein] synthase II